MIHSLLIAHIVCDLNPSRHTENGSLKALWFFEEPSPIEEPFFH